MPFHELYEPRDDIKEDIKIAEETYELMISHRCLYVIPPIVFGGNESLVNLRRLDISFNNISVIPTDIIHLVSLRELWLQHNPIECLPDGIDKLENLEVMDVRQTSIKRFPPELSNLVNMYEFDWRDTPASAYYAKQKVEVNDLNKLKACLKNVFIRKELENSFFDYLFATHFIREADDPDLRQFSRGIVDEVSSMFEDLEQFRLFIKAAKNLLPEKTFEVHTQSLMYAQQEFYHMQRETKRKRLSADVEIKLRAVYFDRIQRTAVEGVLHSIYEHVESLEDIIFLIKYATQVFPPTPAECTGQRVWQNILDLQKELTDKRNNAIAMLCESISQLYPEQEPQVLAETAAAVCSHFAQERFATKRELTNLSRLAVDCSKIFPPDFASVNPKELHTKAMAKFNKKSE
jgi:hypothetical protein